MTRDIAISNKTHKDVGVLEKGYHRLRKGRISLPGQIYHLVFRVNAEEPKLSDLERSCVARLTLDPCITRHGAILCYVVMPDHVHLLVQLTSSSSVSRWVQRFKGMASRALGRKRERGGSLWQAGFYDRALRKDDDVVTVARYIVANPVKAGLVAWARQYPFWNAVWL